MELAWAGSGNDRGAGTPAGARGCPPFENTIAARIITSKYTFMVLVALRQGSV